MSMTALQLAEYTIRRATEKDKTITNLKLQKHCIMCRAILYVL